MKKRIGTLKGLPIVDGDINLIKYLEIHYKKLCEEVEGEVFKIKLSYNEEYGLYVGSAIFPVNVSIPNNGYILIYVANLLREGEEQSIILSEHEDDIIIPANVEVVILSAIQEELFFTQTTKKVTVTYPFFGIGIYEDLYFKDIKDNIFNKFLPIIFDAEKGSFTLIQEDQLLPKYTPIWIIDSAAKSEKLNSIFKEKLNYIFKKK